jgi:O-antigen ligase
MIPTRLIDRGLLVSLLLLAVTIPFSIAASQIALGLAVFFWLFKLLTGYRRELLITPISWGLVVWVFAGLIAALLGDNPKISLLSMREEWLFLGFFVVWGGIANFRQWRLLLAILAVALLLSSGYSIWQHYTGLDLVHEVMLHEMPSGFRTQSTFTHYLTAGGVFSLLGLLTLALYFTLRTNWRWVGLAIAVAGMLAALLTYSRSILLAVAVALVVLLLLLWRQYRGRILLPGLLLILIVLVIAPDIALRFEQPSISTTSQGRIVESRAPRLEIWRTAWRMFLARPLTGVGQDNFLGRYDQFSSGESFLRVATAHNDILHIAASRGIIGVLAYVLFWLLILRWFWRHYRSGPGHRSVLGALALGICAAYLVMSQFESFFLDEEVRLTLFVGLGLLAVGTNLKLPADRS